MFAGLRVQVRPVGDATDVNATVPVKLLIGATLTVAVAATPAVVVTEEGLAPRPKSATVYLTVEV